MKSPKRTLMVTAADGNFEPKWQMFCGAAKVGFDGTGDNLEKSPHARRVFLECGAVLAFEPRFLRKWCGDKHCYSR